MFPTLAGSRVLLRGLIDYGTGAVYSLKPNPAVATLRCESAAEQASQAATDSATEKRLQELKRLLDQSLITPEEYWQKRGEILKGL